VGTASEDTRRRVLDAARRVFAARGVDASTRAIANEADVTVMALYNYAPSKAALFAAVWQESIERVYAGYADSVNGLDSLAEELDAVIEQWRRVLIDEPDLIVFVIRVLVECQRPDHADLIAPVDRALDFMSQLADRSVARGDIPASDRERLISFVFTMFYGLTSVTAAYPASLDHVVDALKWAARRFIDGMPPGTALVLSPATAESPPQPPGLGLLRKRRDVGNPPGRLPMSATNLASRQRQRPAPTLKIASSPLTQKCTDVQLP
jgi:AcrR family transcriptional regulator